MMAAVEARDERRVERDKARMRLEGSPTDAGEMPGWSGRIMVWLRVLAQLIAVQLLMVLGTVLGLFVVGLGPAATSGSALLRRIVDGDPSDAVWRDFWRGYATHLRRAALVVAPLVLVVALAVYEVLVLLANASGPLAAVMIGAVGAMGAYAIAALAYAPHVLRRYTDGPGATLRFVAVAPLLSPLTAIGSVVTTVTLTIVGLKWPFVLVLAGLSIPLLLVGLLVDAWLDKVDRRADAS